MSGEKRARMVIRGDLTVARCAALQRSLLPLLGRFQAVDLVLDEAPRIDSAGLQLLIAVIREMEEGGGVCRIPDLPSTIREFALDAGIDLRRFSAAART